LIVQKWEYLHVTTRDYGLYVLTVNGEVHKHPDPIHYTGFFGGDKTKERSESLPEYLNRMGREGWEVVGFVPTDCSDGLGSHEKTIILKRPLQE
jgi:hypothetical protein